jgi:hypothetical protein
MTKLDNSIVGKISEEDTGRRVSTVTKVVFSANEFANHATLTSEKEKL